MKPYADHFSRLASGYAEYRPVYPEALFDYLAQVVSRHELAWDCAAGSGQASLPLARTFRRVVATDASAEMLEQAPRHPSIEYRVAPAESSGLHDGSVDLVTVAQALHWLTLPPFYAEARRVLVPGGILAAWTYGAGKLNHGPLDKVLDHFYWRVVGPYWPRERCHVESGYQTLPFPFVEIRPPSFDMHSQWTLPQLLGYIGTWSATQRYRETAGHDPVEQLGVDLARHWGDPQTSRRVTWPLSLRLGRRPPDRGSGAVTGGEVPST
ncbi:MAG TPA: class I SAM-dependent methyltransferase [Gemmatimonadales bacterium]|nr:class I SAM-dependent methyltransferase [Gemmatimonadales bacterium]